MFKKTVSIALLFGILTSFFVFTGCTKASDNSVKDISEIDDYILKFDISSPYYGSYTFVLVSEQKLIASYKNSEKSETHEIDISGVYETFMKSYVEKALSFDKSEIEYSDLITDMPEVCLYRNGETVYFDYGCSKCPEVNILLEQFIGCCDFKYADKDNLKSMPEYYGEIMSAYFKGKK